MKRRDHHHLKDDIVDLIRNFLHILRDMLYSSDTEELADEVVATYNEPISVKERLPDDGTWVLAHYNGDNWGEDKGQYWIVAKFIRGRSMAERKADLNYDTRDCISAEDEYGNNERAFYWNEFGPGSKFGQDVDYWMALPNVPTEPTTVNVADNDTSSSFRIIMCDEILVLDAEQWATIKRALYTFLRRQNEGRA